MEIERFIDSFISSYKRYREKWNYEDGCVFKGALDIYNVNDDKRYYGFVLKHLSELVTEEGQLLNYQVEEFNIDNINCGKILFDFYKYTNDDRYKRAADTLSYQLQEHPRTKENNFWHKKIYPNQVWLDGLYMAMPFYARYAKEFGNTQNYQDILDQFFNVEKYMKDEKTGLYYHGYDESRVERWSDPKTGLSPNFWARAMGWFMMAMVDTLEIMDNGHHRVKRLQVMLEDAIDSLIKYQDQQSFMWYQIIDQQQRDGNYLETSATLMMTYSILKGVRLGYLPEKYRILGERAFSGTVKTYLDTEKMELNGICAVAGLGNTPYRDGSFQYYVSEPIDPNDPKGVGALLMAYSEVLRIK